MIKPARITKKWRIEKAREIIDRNRIDVPFCESDTAEFAGVCEQPITGAVRKINPQYPKDPRHLHTEIGGVWDARSWKQFINPISMLQKTKLVMRHVIWEDLRDFASCAEPKECAICGSTEDITVDHVSPPFDHIATEFILANGLPEIKDPDSPLEVVNQFTDINLEAKWIAFHASMACYQLLCRSCNARKGKNVL